MNGRAVYRFATHAVPISIQTALQNAGLTADQVDRFILHGQYTHHPTGCPASGSTDD